MTRSVHRSLVALASACLASGAGAQARPDSVARGPTATTAYDERTDSTTRSLSAYAMIDTSVTPPDTFAVELTQRWQGRDTVAPAAPVPPLELGLGRARAQGLSASPTLRWRASRRPAVVFVLDGARRIRLEQTEYVSNGGATLTFETARYRITPAELRLVADCRELRVRVGDRELWIDPAWRRVAADMAEGGRRAAR